MHKFLRALKATANMSKVSSCDIYCFIRCQPSNGYYGLSGGFGRATYIMRQRRSDLNLKAGNQRAFIRYLMQKGKKVAEIHKKLLEVYRDNALGFSRVSFNLSKLAITFISPKININGKNKATALTLLYKVIIATNIVDSDDICQQIFGSIRNFGNET
uniref:Mos1 transposase HTH domain-containing protein n=1 Tax=Romanomermis culicivorax TaxID=13658 RepID=A0A915LBV6_ROMCU